SLLPEPGEPRVPRVRSRRDAVAFAGIANRFHRRNHFRILEIAWHAERNGEMAGPIITASIPGTERISSLFHCRLFSTKDCCYFGLTVAFSFFTLLASVRLCCTGGPRPYKAHMATRTDRR